MRALTRAEEQVMKVLWDLKKGLLMEIVDKMPMPRPHVNTVATILKTMVDKGFVRIENLGRIHRYHPLITREEYSKSALTVMAKGYFNGSFSDMLSFLIQKKKVSVKDLEILLKNAKKEKK